MDIQPSPRFGVALSGEAAYLQTFCSNMKLIQICAVFASVSGHLVAGPSGYSGGVPSIAVNYMYPEFIAVTACEEVETLKEKVECIREFMNNPNTSGQVRGRGICVEGTSTSFSSLRALAKNMKIEDARSLLEIMHYLDDENPRIRAVVAISCCDYYGISGLDQPSYIAGSSPEMESRESFKKRILTLIQAEQAGAGQPEKRSESIDSHD